MMPAAMDADRPSVRPQAIVAAYLLAVLCLLIPLSVVGSTYAGAVLARRGLRAHGATVLVLGVVCTAVAVLILR